MQTFSRNADFASNLALAYAEYLDGVRPALQRVSMRLQGDGRQIALELRNSQTNAVQLWRLSQLRLVPDQATQDALVLARADGDPARLIIRDRDSARQILAACPKLRPLSGSRGAWPKIAALAVAALAAIAAILFVLVPRTADIGADLIPPEAELALGQSAYERTLAAMEARECKGGEGSVALVRMTERLSTGLDLPYPLTVHVVDDPTINAFAFAGGHIAVFRGLIDFAATPDEVAAVLAHEIGHVANRDSTRTSLRMVGSFGIAGLLFGDVIGASGAAGLTQRYLQSSHSREAELAADAFAHRQLSRAGLSAAALGDMFNRMNDLPGGGDMGVMRHFSTHPEMLERAANAQAAGATSSGQPLLSDAEWQALRSICS